MKPARKVFELQALEIIYLTALTGGTSFPGLTISLENESESKLRSMMDAQMKSLEAKGYLEVDFTGIARMNEGLHKFIEIGSSCVSYLCQHVQRNDETYQTWYFIQDETRFELEHRLGTNTYKLQEIYAQHELMFQVIQRFPLVQDKSGENKSQKAINEELKLETWVEQSLRTGAVIASIAEIQCDDLKAQVMRELILTIHEDQMGMLQRVSEDQIKSTSMNLSTTIEALCIWLQEA